MRLGGSVVGFCARKVLTIILHHRGCEFWFIAEAHLARLKIYSVRMNAAMKTSILEVRKRPIA
jgi:hypothetical protein